MIILGITGGVGSGKSRVLYDLKENYNAYIVEADKLAHELMQPDKSIYNEIVSTFGRNVLEEETPYYIDREKLGSIVFNDSERLTILNGIVHPLVKKEIKRRINEVRAGGKYRLFVIEAALLIQDGYNSICDEIWYIWVDVEERIRRLMKQRGYTREKCLSIIDSQETDEYYKKYANYTINNQNNYENSSKQLKERLNKLLSNGIISE
ncbi:MAG: dephospho-CoA kinase [Lachnospiraceae bacterium]|nr:dephospho-CoA kinase [Lachnospiraceae bacterium]